LNVPVAHETWFVPDYERFGLDWGFAGQTATLVPQAVVVIAASLSTPPCISWTRWS